MKLKKEVSQLDENKEKLTPDTEESTTDAGTDTENKVITESVELTESAESAEPEAIEEAAEAAESEETEAVEEIAEAAVEEAEAAPKKSFVIQRTILISMGIVAIAILVTIICRLFLTNSPVKLDLLGNKASTTWHLGAEVKLEATSDEAQELDFYLIFEPDGKLRFIEDDCLEHIGTYSYDRIGDESEENKGKSYINIDNTGLSLDGKYFFEETGNAFSERTLKLTNIYNSSVNYTFDQKKTFTPAKIELDDATFTKDEDLLGSWTYKTEAFTLTYNFNSDGTFDVTTKTSGSYEKQHGVYNCADGELTLKSGVVQPWQVKNKYEVTDDGLVIYYQSINRQTLQSEEQAVTYKKN